MLKDKVKEVKKDKVKEVKTPLQACYIIVNGTPVITYK